MNETVDEVKNQETTQEQNSIIPAVVRNSTSSGKRTIMRDTASGRFAKTRSKLDNQLKGSEKLEREIQNILDSPALDAEGKPLVDPKTKKAIPLHQAVERNLLQLCATSSDPKILSGASKLLDVLYTRAHGRAKDSPTNRDALSRSAVQVVVITNPDLPVAEEETKEPLSAPSWVVTENPAQNLDRIEDDQE